MAESPAEPIPVEIPRTRMWRIRANEKRRRIRTTLEEAWEVSGRTADDPDIREVFPTLPRVPIHLLALRMNKAINHGGLLRLAEAHRVEMMSYEMEEDRAVDFSGVRGSHKWMPYQFVDPVALLQGLKAQGYRVYGLTLNDRAFSVYRAAWQFPCVLVLGEELTGIRPEIEALCDDCVAIPLYGVTGSLNVGHAAAIAVSQCVNAYADADPGFAPARAVSRRLRGE